VENPKTLTNARAALSAAAPPTPASHRCYSSAAYCPAPSLSSTTPSAAIPPWSASEQEERGWIRGACESRMLCHVEQVARMAHHGPLPLQLRQRLPPAAGEVTQKPRWRAWAAGWSGAAPAYASTRIVVTVCMPRVASNPVRACDVRHPRAHPPEERRREGGRVGPARCRWWLLVTPAIVTFGHTRTHPHTAPPSVQGAVRGQGLAWG